MLGLLASGFGLIFTFGIFARLREKAPTRAVASLGLVFVGLTMHAFGAALLWQGGAKLVAFSAKDQTAAAHAWIALGAIDQALMATANAFTGAAILMAGWAIVATGVMNTTLGWVAIIAGIIEILQVFSSQMAVMALGFILAVVWLAWAAPSCGGRQRRLREHANLGMSGGVGPGTSRLPPGHGGACALISASAAFIERSHPDGGGYQAAIALYPGWSAFHEGGLAAALLMLMGSADDSTPPAQCVEVLL